MSPPVDPPGAPRIGQATQRRHEVEARRDQVAHAIVERAGRCARGIDDDHAHDVHVGGGCLEREERRVEAGQPLHAGHMVGAHSDGAHTLGG